MKWQFKNDRPIYIQLVEILKGDIISNNYPIGQKFPSVRELAQIASVNPNTMQKALIELERQGFLESNRTSGRVISANFEKIKDERDSLSTQIILEFLSKMNTLGYKTDQVITMIQEVQHDTGRN